MGRWIAGVLTLAALAGGLTAAAAPAGDGGDGGDGAGSWSLTRMARAADLDGPGGVPGTTRLAARPSPVRTAAAWTGRAAVTRAVGRVFYSQHGRDYTCTGVAVRSANRSTVLAAGHCVNAGPGGYARDWVFMPGYADGRRPYGIWRARSLAAPARWVREGRTADDVGYAVVAPLRGRRLTDVVGGVPIAFDAPRGAYVWVLGYPAAVPNAGRRALFCRGTVRADPYGTGAQGLACSMTQGASGGPWLTAAPDGRPTAVYAVTSFTYHGVPGVVWAPYLGGTARALWSAVQRR